MGAIFSAIAQPFGLFLKYLYELFGNYGWALVVFTIIVNIIIMPLTLKQQKSAAEMQKIQPKIKEIQKRYANDKEKQSQELMKIYKENGVNPAGGCLPLLIQFPIIIILYQVIMKPLTYMYSVSDANIKKLQELLGYGTDKFVQQIELARNITPQIRNMEEFKHIPAINFNFFGLDLGATPTFALNALLIIPVLAALTSYVLTTMSQKISNQPGSDNPAASSVSAMSKVMPLITAFFTFSLPAGIGLYWVIGNVVRIVQQYFINERFLKQRESETLVAEVVKPKKINMNNVGGNNNKRNK